MQMTLYILCILVSSSHYLFSNGPPEEPQSSPPVVTPYVPREALPVKHNPGHH